MANKEQQSIGELTLIGASNGTVTVLERDSAEKVSKCKCATGSIPSVVAGYAVGCLLIDTTTGHLYVNTGSITSCTFNDVGAVAAGEISLATGSILVGAAGVGAALDVKSNGNVIVGNGTTIVSATPDTAGLVAKTGVQSVGGVKTFSAQMVLQTAHSGILIGAGASGANHSLGAVADNALEFYLDATHTTGDMRGAYLRLYFSGDGGSGEAARIFSTINNVSVATGGTVNGAHISIGTSGAAAAVAGAANALRVTFGIAAASTNIGGTCSVIQVDTDLDNAVTVPTNFAFLRFTNTNTKKSNNLMRIPNVLAETGGLFCAHDTQVMTHSIKIVSEDGTPYYVMCTNAITNRTES